MCNKAVDHCEHALEFVSDLCKTQEICNKVVNTSPSATQSVSECSKTQEMCDKTFDTCSFMSILFLINI